MLRTINFILFVGTFLFMMSCTKGNNNDLSIVPIDKDKEGSCDCSETDSTVFTVMQFNIWQEGTSVTNGYNGIVDEIVHYKPDFVSLIEIRNYNNIDFLDKLLNSLRSKGLEYFSNNKGGSSIISKYPILEFSKSGDIHSMHKIVAKIDTNEIAFYAAHLDYTKYAEYLPRGYNGSGSAKLPGGIETDVATILAEDARSTRPRAISEFLTHQLEDVAKNRLIILAGDFNEASHLDWTERTKHLYDRNGVVINWPSSTKLYQNKYKDSFREIYPNELTHPGFTWPLNSPWLQDMDERDRIDFIYYREDERLKPLKSHLIGPDKIYIGNKLSEDAGEDVVLLPQSTWPSDHRALITHFLIK